MSIAKTIEKLSLRTKLTYGVGDAGINLADTMVGLLFAIFLTDVVGLRPGLAALAVFIGRTSDYINDPLIGYLSDRTRTRWGRRRPFLLIGALPFAIAYALLWWHPPIESQIELAIYYGIAFILYDTTATILYMPYFALTPELTSDPILRAQRGFIHRRGAEPGFCAHPCHRGGVGGDQRGVAGARSA